MIIVTLNIKLHASWVHSLKEKRMIVKSLIGRLRNRFNVTAAETGEQDIHQIIVMGVASIAAHNAQADSIAQEIEQFVEESTEAEIMRIEKEIVYI